MSLTKIDIYPGPWRTLDEVRALRLLAAALPALRAALDALESARDVSGAIDSLRSVIAEIEGQS